MTCIDIFLIISISYPILLSRVHLITVDCSNWLQWRPILHDVRFFSTWQFLSDVGQILQADGLVPHDGCANTSVLSSVELQSVLCSHQPYRNV